MEQKIKQDDDDFENKNWAWKWTNKQINNMTAL